MQVLFDGPDLEHEFREMETLPRQGEDVKLNGSFYRVGVITWYPDDDDSPDVLVEVKNLAKITAESQ